MTFVLHAVFLFYLGFVFYGSGRLYPRDLQFSEYWSLEFSRNPTRLGTVLDVRACAQ